MRIGIDIDGVLTDIERWQIDYSTKFYCEKYGKEIVNSKGYDTAEIFNMSLKNDDEFWLKYYMDYSTNIKARRFSGEVIQKLKEEKNEIYIITARNNKMNDGTVFMDEQENKNQVINWLKENKITYDKLIFSPENKVDICKNNNIDLMIDDRPENVMDVSKLIPVICFNAGYNEKCSGKNIFRCYSWYDVYMKIKNIEKLQK